MRRAISLAAAGVVLAAAVSAQTPARDARPAAPAPPPAGTASIGGVVVSADSVGRPIRLAYVVVIGAGTGTLRVTATDASGRFSVTGLPADRYLVGASKLPYLGTMAGARRPARPGVPIALGEGQRLTDVTIRMPLGAAITGVVTDERGQPGAGVSIVAQQWRLQNGERTLVTAAGGTTATDERGRYRIHGLPPGEYLLSAVRTQGQPNPTLTDAAVDEALRTGRGAAAPATPTARYVPVFFPGTPRVSDAAPIVVVAGEERANVDVRLELARTSRVEGMVVTLEGQATPGALIFLASASSNVQSSIASTMSAPDGRFIFPAVAPGSYTLSARVSGSQQGRPPQFAAAPVEVGGTDVLGLQLTVLPPLSFSARIAFDGAAPVPGLAGRRLSLRSSTPLPSGPGGSPQVAPTSAAGTFTVSNVPPGRYVFASDPLYFGATSNSVTWSLRSVVVDGRDVTDLPFEVTSDTVPKDVVVTYSDQWQQVSGRLSSASGAATTDYTVVIFPSDKAYWISGTRRIVTTRPSTDGRFTLGGQGPAALPPGKYLLAVVTEIDRDEQFDPAFLSSVMPAALPIDLQPGEKKTQDVVIKSP